PMFNNNRRNILLTIVIISSIIFISACGDSSANGSQTENSDGQEITLDIASHIHGNHSQFKDMIEPLMEEIEKETDGRITAEYYAGGALGDPSQDYEIAATGVADIAIGQYGYTPGKFPISSFNDLPFLGESSVEATELFWELHEQFPEITEE